jgi:hypothetical protein
MPQTLDSILDAGLLKINADANRITYCDKAVTNYTEATTASSAGGNNGMLANVAWPGPGAIADNPDPEGGRQLTVPAIASISPIESGTIIFACIVDDDNSLMLERIEMTSLAIAVGQPFRTDPHRIIFRDPVIA